VTPVKLSIQEAETVIRLTYTNHQTSGEHPFDMLPDAVKLQAMAGAIGIVDALQQMGYRITRPLKVVGE
jgi:hypothetical protein